MPRTRDRRFLDRTELWSERTSPSGAAPTAYVAIARTFARIDRVMLDEMQEDRRRCGQPHEESSRRRRTTLASRFDDMQAHPDVESYFEDVKERISHPSSEIDVLAYLADTKCLTAWNWVCNAVLENQGSTDTSDLPSWTQAKVRAKEILHLAQAVLETYDSDEFQGLVHAGSEGIDAGIEAKMSTLALFERIYCRPTNADITNKKFPLCHPFDRALSEFFLRRKNKIKARKAARYAKTHPKRDAILVTVTVFAIAISAIPLGLAFHTSTTNAPGSTSDADFWLLIQNSLMQVLSLTTTALISLMPRPEKQPILVWPRFLTWAMSIIGLGCALNASLLYVRVPPMYSSLMSFMANAAQACMVLQLALFVDASGRGEKMD